MYIARNLLFILMASLLFAGSIKAQQKDTTDLMSMLEEEENKSGENQTDYATATFKTTRLINGHSVENVGKGVLDLKISHRFGTLNKGGYELFGLDNASMRIGLDYGITNRLMVGIGRGTFEKTYDAFFKYKILRQSKGRRNMPISLSVASTFAYKTLKWEDPNRENFLTSRMFFTHQLIIARKFSEGTSLQLMPTFTHRNLVSLQQDPNDLIAIGIGGRQKLTKRVSINAEYYYQVPGYKLAGTTDCFSLGFDIETGGHVFQLHFTNSQGMSERQFITETKGNWGKGDILFGFNISRVFTIGKHR